MSNAQRCKAYRRRQNLIRDSIEKSLDKHVAELRKQRQLELTEGKKINIVDHYEKLQDSGREPQRDLVSQFNKSDKEEHFSLFDGSQEGSINKLDLISHQRKLQLEFGDKYAE